MNEANLYPNQALDEEARAHRTKIVQKILVLAIETLVVLLLIYVPTVAQTQAPAPSKVMVGLLTKVNPDTKTFSVKPSEGKEIEFTYNDDTEILNAEHRPEGLADKTGTQLRVIYDDHAGKLIAVRIEVEPLQP
jgi:hypothetical protein